MDTVIKRPVVGQTIQDDDLGISGDVYLIVGWEEMAKALTPLELRRFEPELLAQLGEKYKSLFFEAYVLVTDADANSGFEKGEAVQYGWQEFQDVVIIK